MRFTTHIPGTTPIEEVRWLKATGSAGAAGYETTCQVEGDRLIHMVSFPGGWRRIEGGALDIEFSDRIENALSMSRSEVQHRQEAGGFSKDPAPEGRLVSRRSEFTQRITLEFIFPKGYRPGEPRLEATFSTGNATVNAPLENVTCRSASLEVRGRRLIARIEEPIPFAAFHVIWKCDEKWMSP